MTRRLKVGLAMDAEASAMEMMEAALNSENFAVSVFDSRTLRTLQRDTVAPMDMVAVLYPERGNLERMIGLASGQDKPLITLISPETPRKHLPRDALLAKSTRQMFSMIRRTAARLGKKETVISPETLVQYGACSPGVDWYRTQYPDGAPVKDWSAEEQKRMVLDGGARWLHGAFRYGLIDPFPMSDDDFSAKDLRLARLQGMVLDRSNFSDAILERANLSDVSGLNTQWVCANLTGIRFRRACLNAADFSHSLLNESALDQASAIDARFVHADCKQTTFINADLANADFSKADLRHACFRGTNLTGAIFTGAHLQQTDFQNADINPEQLSPEQREQAHGLR